MHAPLQATQFRRMNNRKYDIVHTLDTVRSLVVAKAAAARWCRGPTSASRWEKREFDSTCGGIFFFVVFDSHRGKRESASKQRSQLSLFDVS